MIQEDETARMNPVADSLFRQPFNQLFQAARDGNAEGVHLALMNVYARTSMAENTRGASGVIGNILTKCIGITSESPKVKKASALIDRALDALDPSTMPLYHSLPHHLNVPIVASAFAVYDRSHDKLLEIKDVEDIFLAGKVHDLLHPGGTNGAIDGVPQYFRIEYISWEHAGKIFREAGFDDERIEKIRLLVMVTEPAVGPNLVDAALHYRYGTGDDEKLHAMRERNNAIIKAEHFAAQAREKEPANRELAKLWEQRVADIKSLADRLFKDEGFLRLSELLTKADIFYSIASPETSLNSTQTLDKEYKEKGVGMVLVGDDGLPDINSAKYFFNMVARVNGRFLVRTIQDILGLHANVTKDIVCSGKLAAYLVHKKNGTKRKGPTRSPRPGVSGPGLN